MRSGWDRDARYLLFDGVPFGTCHQHEDKLSIILWAYGKNLIVDGGTHYYDSSKWRQYVLTSQAHNVVIVDGQGQRRRIVEESFVSKDPINDPWVATDRLDYVASTFGYGYGLRRDIKAIHQRSVVFVKPDYWVVLDKLEPDRERTFETLFHLNVESAESQGGVVYSQDNTGANISIHPIGPGMNVDIIKGREEPLLGWIASAKKPIPTVVYRQRGKDPIVKIGRAHV